MVWLRETTHDVDGLLKQKDIGSVPDPFGACAYTASDKRSVSNGGMATRD